METHWVQDTPIGPLTAWCGEEGVLGLHFGDQPRGLREESSLAVRVFSQLEEYFRGERREFDLPLAPQGTPFQQSVWTALTAIPYGQTRTYAQVAQQVGNPKACRAVGMANNRNPIAILIPCHRVVGQGGALTGYAGGLSIKEYLLELERGETPM